MFAGPTLANPEMLNAAECKAELHRANQLLLEACSKLSALSNTSNLMSEWIALIVAHHSEDNTEQVTRMLDQMAERQKKFATNRH